MKAKIRVVVSNESGMRLRDSEVYLDNNHKGTTDSKGIFMIEDIEPGSHTVKASRPHYHDSAEDVTLKPEETKTIYMKLRGKISTIKAVVASDLGKKLKDVEIYLDNHRRGATDSSGIYIMEVDPGKYVIKASKTGLGEDSKEVTVAPGEIVTVELKLHMRASRI
ncbi:MAG: carboxypeptidase regulatory-like domain-containing protein [Theionarchaea archaeon]|nr:carboxypeptidase regulatory-like domain-containing protein [Theionarchaea archaeon]